MELNDKIVPKGKEEKGSADNVSKSGFFARMKKNLTEGLMVLSVAGTVTAITVASCSSKDETQPIPEADGGCLVDGGVCPDGAGGDAGHDSGVGGDAGYDSGVGGDAGYDSGVGGDAGSGGMDAGPVACVLATTGSMNGYINKIHPTIVGGYSFLYVGMEMPDGSSDAVSATLSIVCGAESVNPSLVCPIGIDKQFDVPKDGMKITVNAVEAGAGSVYVHLRVESL